MAYELEPFGIKVIIIEPGTTRTNIFNSSTVAKKSQDPNSPYSLMQKMASGFEGMLKKCIFS
jgi:short-subunit dehydrogenase